jgi:hypothetical protein
MTPGAKRLSAPSPIAHAPDPPEAPGQVAAQPLLDSGFRGYTFYLIVSPVHVCGEQPADPFRPQWSLARRRAIPGDGCRVVRRASHLCRSGLDRGRRRFVWRPDRWGHHHDACQSCHPRHDRNHPLYEACGGRRACRS